MLIPVLLILNLQVSSTGQDLKVVLQGLYLGEEGKDLIPLDHHHLLAVRHLLNPVCPLTVQHHDVLERPVS
jgi:hypothetical protein